MLNNDDFNLLNTLFPAWQQLTTKQQQIISQNASLIQVKKNNFVHTTKEGCSGILIIKKGQLRVYTLSEQGKDITFYRLNDGDISILSASCVIKDITFDYCEPHTCDFNHELGDKIVSVYRNMYVEIDKDLSNTV